MDRAEIIIAGGGIAGLAAAIAVAPRETLLLERAAEWQEVGAGLQLGPNAVRALQKLGAWDAVQPCTSAPPGILIMDGVSGRLVKQLPLGKDFERRFGAPYRVAHRADLHRALRSVAAQSSQLQIKLGTALLAFQQAEDSVSVSTSTAQFRGKALLAADGVHSPVRQQLFEGSQPCSAGHTIYRALVDAPACAKLNQVDCVHVWLYPNGHVVHYPAGSSQRLNLVAVCPEGFGPSETFANACTVLGEILALPDSWLQWPALCVAPLASFTNNRVLLLGDAAHATVPYLAQGAAMAIEDAAALREAFSQDGSVTEKLLRAQADRPPRTRKLQLASLRQAKLYHAAGLARHLALPLLQVLPDAAFWAKMKSVYAT